MGNTCVSYFILQNLIFKNNSWGYTYCLNPLLCVVDLDATHSFIRHLVELHRRREREREREKRERERERERTKYPKKWTVAAGVFNHYPPPPKSRSYLIFSIYCVLKMYSKSGIKIIYAICQNHPSHLLPWDISKTPHSFSKAEYVFFSGWGCLQNCFRQ